jgi:hypothetical protein
MAEAVNACNRARRAKRGRSAADGTSLAFIWLGGAGWRLAACPPPWCYRRGATRLGILAAAQETAMSSPLPPEWRHDPHIPRDLIDMRCHLDQLPLQFREKLVMLCDRVGHYARLQSRLVRIAQDAVDQLQLDVKYLSFDLEATRRERDEAIQQLRELAGNEDD